MFCGLLRLPFTCKHLEAYRLHEKRRGRRKSPFLSPPYPFPPFMTYSIDLLSFWSYNHIVVIYNILNTKHPEVRYGYSVLCFLFVVFIHLSGYQTIKKKRINLWSWVLPVFIAFWVSTIYSFNQNGYPRVIEPAVYGAFLGWLPVYIISKVVGIFHH